ncbi:hypothetical protein FPSE_05854 [Fusarium pseudograminearum CS3096]|uniref:Zn(2)-C6 fungal-type domain-containing protein n=1 Tax=Fusarium pseudograminearum (strain CS3096) TaxID=1028729 RepID=K3VKH5_FUSPC|nr:hypothetical protein FPSE_05854 [Fusarium pseudograminearum CS3096]EKJ73893.1 hypothetical protein FPSE_05854 [Fusarium pseudograminearum CS3096]KAF0642756.1 hypothetical protein FPSE5266_05854 [Fusarium pseudograminearum]
MGRKPNPLILEYFVRGPKLNDNSNRYPHTCKQCGENFPKGRIDSLTTHITKKCPAISESDRMRACLELHGITNARAPAERPPPETQPNGQPVDVPNLPQGWSALETLAEASRQVDLNENNRAQSVQASVDPSDPANPQHVSDRFELHEQFTLDNPPVSCETRSQQGSRGVIQQPLPGTELSPEERLQALLPNSDASPDVSNISVAVAATARLNPSLLDPQLVDENGSATPPPTMEIPATIETSPSAVTAPDSGISQPWGEMTYLTTASPVSLIHEHPPPPIQMTRGGIRMDTSDGQLNGRPRHARSRFTAARRKEVQEVRKIGACIRCRILRKNCGKGTPCDTCRKVLAPRVWRTGCVRTRLQEQLDLYSAGVQVVLSQNRINLLKNQLNMAHDGTVIEVSHFPETGKVIVLEAMVALLEPSDTLAEIRGSKESFIQVIMIDQDKEDVPGKVEAYMRDVFQLFIDREPSKFMRVTLDLALQQLQESEDDLLRKSLELWGLVESIDRERQWNVVERPANENEEPRRIQEAKSENDADIYTTLCMQLNAAAERKANNTSKALLSGMHRVLQDSKVKVNFKMYLTAVIFLNCLEKSTWAFKAWEQDHLRPGWPLERDPSVFTQQGDNLAGLLKMLLAIRKALPQTLRGETGKLITSEQDPVIGAYFQSIDLDYDTILSRQEGSPFSPADSRSLEMMFCSHLLITNSP